MDRTFLPHNLQGLASSPYSAIANSSLLFIYFFLCSASCSYGGPPCSDYVDARIHVAEGVVWTAITFLLFWGLGMYGRLHRLAKQAMEHERAIHAKRSWFDVALATVHMAVFYQLVNYKMVSRTMLIQLQPCHIILALQAFILMSPPRKLPLVLSLLHLPWMAGCLAAMVVPDTQGLLQFFEVEIYWIEHILVAITTPLYLMLRHEAAVTRLFNSDALLCGVWTLLPFHWPLVASINFYTKVNLNFMLCPTEGRILRMGVGAKGVREKRSFPRASQLTPWFFFWPLFFPFSLSLLFL